MLRAFIVMNWIAKAVHKKTADEQTYALLKDKVAASKDFSKDEIIARMMLPFLTETIRCLEDKIVATAQEADMAMIYGLGFPPFRGGPMRYIDQSGAANILASCEQYAPSGRTLPGTRTTQTNGG